jgi:hypothetical protein
MYQGREGFGTSHVRLRVEHNERQNASVVR